MNNLVGGLRGLLNRSNRRIAAMEATIGRLNPKWDDLSLEEFLEWVSSLPVCYKDAVRAAAHERAAKLEAAILLEAKGLNAGCVFSDGPPTAFDTFDHGDPGALAACQAAHLKGLCVDPRTGKAVTLAVLQALNPEAARVWDHVDELISE